MRLTFGEDVRPAPAVRRVLHHDVAGVEGVEESAARSVRHSRPAQAEVAGGHR